MHISQPAPSSKPASFADPEALMTRLGEMILSGRLDVARPLLAAVERLTEPSPRRQDLTAWLLMRENRCGEAAALLDHALFEAPEDVPLRRRRAELRLVSGNLPGAARDAAEAVVLDRADPAAKALLGTALLGLGHTAEAESCMAEAVAGAPGTPLFHRGLAAAREALGDMEGAAAALLEGIEANPYSLSLRTALVLLHVRQRDFTTALACFEDARGQGVGDACLFGLKGHCLSSLGRHKEAADAYADALKLGPDDLYVRHLAAASGAVPASERAPGAYVRAVFDGYAPYFDTHLLDLRYRVPGLIRATILRHAPGAGDMLDLGCGTGLLGVALSDLGLRMIGVDLSPAMLREAEAKDIYAELHEADLLRFLADETRRFPLAAAADVLCYFGALDRVLADVAARLLPGGRFVVSFEALDGAPGTGPAWALGLHARYAHRHDYVLEAAAAAGFTVAEDQEAILREESGVPVLGRILVLERRAA